MSIRGIHHIGIAVESLDKALRFFSGTLGLRVEETVVVEEEGMRAAWLDVRGVRLEVMEPLGQEGPISRFLSKRGEGVHHIALLVDNMGDAMGSLKDAGIVLAYEEPRVSHDGSKYNFIHPKSAHGVLIELREESS